MPLLVVVFPVKKVLAKPAVDLCLDLGVKGILELCLYLLAKRVLGQGQFGKVVQSELLIKLSSKLECQVCFQADHA